MLSFSPFPIQCLENRPNKSLWKICLIVNRHNSHVSGDCLTISGAVTGKKCIFPFRYNGILHHLCTKDDHDKLWCSTLTDENGDHVDGQWGNCGLCGSGKYHILNRL